MTDPETASAGWPRRLWRRYWLVLLLTIAVTMLHYNTAIHIHAAHGIYRRLYYFPIILAAFRGGSAGGIGAAALICLVYLPHAFGLIGFDPAPTIEKILEMVLYLAVGVLTGGLVSRLNAAGARLGRTAGALQRSLDEKTAMEAELVRAARLAAVGRLSAGLAHEIRNPLASIQGSAEVLADDFPGGHPKARILDILLAEARRLNDVLTRFLAFARSEPGEREPVDLAAEARAVGDLVGHGPDSPAIEVIPGTPGPCTALGDRQQIRQVLLNLTLNAAAAAGSSGRVRLVVGCDEDAVTCRVEDTGTGFSAEALEQFGTPFFTTRESGTGLGLATSLRITEDHGGRLEVDTGHSAGGCVVLSLPAAEGSPTCA